MIRDWLTKRRKEMQLTYDEISSFCNISRQYYSMIENGDRNPSVKVAKKIATVLQFDWTKFYENYKEPKNASKNDGPKAVAKKSDKKSYIKQDTHR